MQSGGFAMEHAVIEKLYHVLKGIEKTHGATPDEVGVNFYDTGIITLSVKGKEIEFFFDVEDFENWVEEQTND